MHLYYSCLRICVCDVIDKDGDGSISSAEFGIVLRSLGDTGISEHELAEIMRQIDSDGSGEVDFDEFLALMANNAPDEEAEILAAFQVFDADGSGSISASELRHVMANLGEKLSDEELEEMIREADTDGDGEISIEEFAMMINPCPQF